MKFVAVIILSGTLLAIAGCASGSLSIDTDAFTDDSDPASSARVQKLEKKVDQLEDKVENLEERVEKLE